MRSYKKNAIYTETKEWCDEGWAANSFGNLKSDLVLSFAEKTHSRFQANMERNDTKAKDLLTVAAAFSVLVATFRDRFGAIDSIIEAVLAFGSVLALVTTVVACIATLSPRPVEPPLDPEEFWKQVQIRDKNDGEDTIFGKVFLAKRYALSQVTISIAIQSKSWWLIRAYWAFGTAICLWAITGLVCACS